MLMQTLLCPTTHNNGDFIIIKKNEMMKCYIIFERDRWSLSSFNMHACIVDHRVLDAPADGNHVRLNAVVR